MLYLLGVLVVAVGIAVSIALHEIGHLLPAKSFGVKVTQYMVGFGPTIFSRRRGETEYGVKAVPLGGYIRMIGMFPPRAQDHGRLRPSSTGRLSQMTEQVRAEALEEVGPNDWDRVFYKLPVWKRVVIMMGGPLMNLAIAAVLLTVLVAGIGLPTLTSTVSQVTPCASAQATECEQGDASPAALAGVQPGDTIVAVAGAPVDSWGEASRAIQNAPRETTVVVDRDGADVPLDVSLVGREVALIGQDGQVLLDDAGDPVLEERSFFGVSPSRVYVAEPLSAAPGFVGQALQDTAGVFLTLPQKLVGVWHAAFGDEERDPQSPMSVVGAGRTAGEIASSETLAPTLTDKVALLVSLLASLNLALFVFNMIPLLPLDGGHVAGALWEGVKKGWAMVRGLPTPAPVDIAKAMPLAYTVALTFIGMTLLLVYADLVNPVRLGG